METETDNIQMSDCATYLYNINDLTKMINSICKFKYNFLIFLLTLAIMVNKIHNVFARQYVKVTNIWILTVSANYHLTNTLILNVLNTRMKMYVISNQKNNCQTTKHIFFPFGIKIKKGRRKCPVFILYHFIEPL